MDRCALCFGQNRLEKSHIIPNSFFKRIKPNGRAVEIHPYSPKSIRTVQNSWYEELLCRKCEALIGEWERYSIGVILTPEVFNVRKEISSKLNEKWFGVDYKKFRLFQLSILFRSSVARGEAWANVRLSKDETELLRKSLIEEKPFNPSVFGCLIGVLINPVNNQKMVQTVGSPSFEIINNRKHFVFTFGGYIWEFVLPKFTYKEKMSGCYLNEKGFLKCQSISLWDHPIVGKAFRMAYYTEAERIKNQAKP